MMIKRAKSRPRTRRSLVREMWFLLQKHWTKNKTTKNKTNNNNNNKQQKQNAHQKMEWNNRIDLLSSNTVVNDRATSTKIEDVTNSARIINATRSEENYFEAKFIDASQKIDHKRPKNCLQTIFVNSKDQSTCNTVGQIKKFWVGLSVMNRSQISGTK